MSSHSESPSLGDASTSLTQQQQNWILSEENGSINTDSSNSSNTNSIIDPFLLYALHNPRDRLTLLKLDHDLEKFIRDPKQQRLTFPPMTSYQRLIVHRVAQYFHLDHAAVDVDRERRAVILFKTPETRIPVLRLSDLREEPETSPQKTVQIMRRGNNKDRDHNRGSSHSSPRSQQDKSHSSISPSSSPHSQASTPATPTSSVDKSLEERENEYAKARARIFNETSSPPPTVPTTSSPPLPSTSSISPNPNNISPKDKDKVALSDDKQKKTDKTRNRKPQPQPYVQSPLEDEIMNAYAEDMINNENNFWPPHNYLSFSLSNSYDNLESWDPISHDNNNNNNYVINQNININNIYELQQQQQQQQNILHRQQVPYMNTFYDEFGGSSMPPWPSQMNASAPVFEPAVMENFGNGPMSPPSSPLPGNPTPSHHQVPHQPPTPIFVNQIQPNYNYHPQNIPPHFDGGQWGPTPYFPANNQFGPPMGMGPQMVPHPFGPYHPSFQFPSNMPPVGPMKPVVSTDYERRPPKSTELFDPKAPVPQKRNNPHPPLFVPANAMGQLEGQMRSMSLYNPNPSPIPNPNGYERGLYFPPPSTPATQPTSLKRSISIPSSSIPSRSLYDYQDTIQQPSLAHILEIVNLQSKSPSNFPDLKRAGATIKNLSDQSGTVLAIFKTGNAAKKALEEHEKNKSNVEYTLRPWNPSYGAMNLQQGEIETNQEKL